MPPQETVIGEADAGMNISAKSEKTIEGRFSLKYLSLFCKAANLSNTIELFLKGSRRARRGVRLASRSRKVRRPARPTEAYPLIIKYNVASLGELRFCVAPKVDD